MNPSFYAWPGMKGVKVDLLSKKINHEEIVNRACKMFSVTVNQLKSSTRQRNVTEARHVAMYYMSIELKMGLTEIGRIFNRHHTSVMHARDRIIHFLQVYPDYSKIILEIKYDFGLTIGQSEIEPRQDVFERPPAIYSNSGSIQTTQKYAV